jgi:hypothetical protein
MLLPPSPAPGERGALRVLDERESIARTALRLQRAEPRKFVDLARSMGIPSHDAARQVMEILETRAMLSPCGSRTNGR